MSDSAYGHSEATVRKFIGGLRRIEEMREEIDLLIATLNGLAMKDLSTRDSLYGSDVPLARTQNGENGGWLRIVVCHEPVTGKRVFTKTGWSGQTLTMLQVLDVYERLPVLLGTVLEIFPKLRNDVSSIQKFSQF